jgi:hypothetical protein
MLTDHRGVDPAARKSQPDIVAKIDFNSKIRPILEARCRPCHFQGGKMYARLPFDRPQTIRSLGTKLFSRIKNKDEQALIRAFLAQPTDSAAAAPKPR